MWLSIYSTFILNYKLKAINNKPYVFNYSSIIASSRWYLVFSFKMWKQRVWAAEYEIAASLCSSQWQMRFCHCETCWKHVVAITFIYTHNLYLCLCIRIFVFTFSISASAVNGNLIHSYPQYSYGISNVLIIRYISLWLVVKFLVFSFWSRVWFF